MSIDDIKAKIEQADARYAEAKNLYAEILTALKQKRQEHHDAINAIQAEVGPRWARLDRGDTVTKDDTALLERLLSAAASTFGCQPSEIMSTRRPDHVVKARFAVIRYLASQGRSTCHIAALLNKQVDAITYATRKYNGLVSVDPAARRAYERFTALITNP